MAHILLIEPDYLLAQTFLQALKTAGHSVAVCATAQTAIMAADQQKPDAVLLELQLIEHSGIEFLYEFRSYEDWQQVPVVIHSQVPVSEFTANWQLLKNELGVTTYLYKPATSLGLLLDTVNQSLAATV